MNNLPKSPQWLKLLIILIITLGIFFRFANIDKKIYWGDETFTSLRLSGYTMAEVNIKLFNGRIVGVEDIQKYQQTNSQKSLSDTIRGLAIEEPQLPPLYFTITRLWVNNFGNSIAVTRSISAISNLLVFPCTYWLCLELFASPLVGSIAMGIMAIAPIHVLYAQEARPYSLWTVTIILSSAAFLQALRLKTKLNWLVYTITTVLSLYTFLLSVLVLIAQGLYLFVISGGKLTKTFITYLTASILALIAFMPWIITILINLNSLKETSKWALQKIPISDLLQEWLRNISYSFMDFWYYFTYFPDSIFNLNFGLVFITLILILIVYSFYFIYRTTDLKIWFFILTLMIFNCLPLILPDLILGGYRSIMARYFIPCYLGIQLSVAYLFANKIKSSLQELLVTQVWRLLLIVLLTGGIISCGVSSQLESWWNKRTTANDHVLVAKVINQTFNPLLIMDDSLASAASLSYRLNPDVKFNFFTNQNIPTIPQNFSNVFVLHFPNFPIQEFVESEKYNIKLIYKGRKKNLWKLESFHNLFNKPK